MAQNELMPAVVYVRMSSGQQEASPSQQREEIKKLADKHQCKILREYYDDGISGDATEKRKGFQAMIRDAEELGDFSAILCWDISRFGRFDSIEAGRWIYPLREAGVSLITSAEGVIDWNDFASRMVYSIQQEGKKQFLLDLSRNVLRGKIQSAKKGGGSGLPPCGYDRAFYDSSGKLAKLVPHGEKFRKPAGWSVRFVVSQDTTMVEVVRWLFDSYVNSDCSITWLAADLNRRGIPTSKGNKWSVQTVERLLTNRTYTGANVFGRKQHGKYFRLSKGQIGKGSRRITDGDDPIIVDDVHDVLVPTETFERAQRKIADRRKSGRKPRNSRYILSGVLRCGHCGGTLAGKGYDAGGVPRYYICVTGNTRPGACHRYQVQQVAIEKYILGKIEQLLLDDGASDRYRTTAYRQAKARATSKGTTRGLKAQIDALDKKIAKGTGNLLLANPDDMASLSSILADWREERGRLQDERVIAAKKPDTQTPKEKTRQVMTELQRLGEQFKTAEPMKVRSVVKSLIDEIHVWWEPYGKRNRRVASGVIHFKDQLAHLSTETKIASAISSAPGIPIA